MNGRILTFTLSLGALVLAGCYSYQPIDVADIRPEMDIRARVSGPQADALADALLSDDRTIEGTVIDNGTDELLLEVTAAAVERRGRLETLNQRVRLPTSEIQVVDEKRSDQTKTTLLVLGGVGVAAAAVVLAITSGSSNSTSTGGPGGPQDILIPLFRLPLGR
jgi:hypothetical protein